MLARADHALASFPRSIPVKEAQPRLHSQDAAHGVVDACKWNAAGARVRERARVHLLPVFGHHQQIDAGEHGARAIGLAAPGQLAVGVPIAHDETGKAHAILQHRRHETAVAGHLDALPTREGNHHAHHARVDRSRVTGSMNADEIRLTDLRITLVDAPRRAAVAQKMLRGRRHVPALNDTTGGGLTLQAAHHRRGIRTHEFGRLRIALVGATPTVVARHGDARGEDPVKARRGSLHRRCRANSAQQLRVVRGAEGDVVRKDRGACDVAVAVHGIDPEHHRNRHVARARFDRHRTIGPGRVDPGPGARPIGGAEWRRIAAGQHRTERVAAQVTRRHARNVALDHLADFLLEAHPREQATDEGLGLRIHEAMGRPRRPACGIRDTALGGCIREGRTQQQGRND